MFKQKEPIFALATPRGKSAIAVFRVSGKKSHTIIKKISSQKIWKNKQTKTNYLLDGKTKRLTKH